MRFRPLALAVAASLGMTSFASYAVPVPQVAPTATSSTELSQLQAQLAVLQAKVNELEQRTDAQSDINVSTGQTVETVQKVQTADAKTVAAIDKLVSNTSLSGKMYFDFTNLDDKNSDTGKTNKSGVGLDVKRFYLGISHKFNDVWSANLTTDFNYVSSAGQTSLFVKKAYVQGKFSDAFVVRAGSADLPWVPLAENYYGFRYVENTLIDRLKYGTSADWGLHASGDLGSDRSFNYAASIINGAGYKNPSRSNRVDFEGRVGFVPFENMIVAVGGYSGKLGKEVQTTVGGNTAQRGDLMLAYASKAFRLGGEYFTAKNWNNVLSPLTDKASGYSLWGSIALTDDLALFARYDNASLSKQLDRNAKDTYYNFGAQYQVSKGFKLAAVWKHEHADKTVFVPVPTHVQQVRTNEVGVWGEVAF